jgi:hypothetical protein
MCCSEPCLAQVPCGEHLPATRGSTGYGCPEFAWCGQKLQRKGSLKGKLWVPPPEKWSAHACHM